jgi:hypothetical protein
MGDAPALDGALLKWLESSDGKRIRLPVVIHFGDEYKLDYGPIYVGTQTGSAPEGAIHLELDDGGMSVGLFDQLLDRPVDNNHGLVLWLEGRWGALVSMPDFDDDPSGGGPERHPFSVFEIVGDVDAGTSHIQFAPA